MDKSKLPKWVQDEIERLEKSVAYWEHQAHAAAGFEGGTDTRLVAMDSQGSLEGRGLPPGADIWFQLEGDGWEGRVTVSVREGKLFVSSGDAIMVRPEAANRVCILIDHREASAAPKKGGSR